MKQVKAYMSECGARYDGRPLGTWRTQADAALAEARAILGETEPERVYDTPLGGGALRVSVSRLHTLPNMPVGFSALAESLAAFVEGC